MTTVPGLTPFGDDTPGKGNPTPSRPVVAYDGPKVPRLQPTAQPVETYFRPPAASQTNELTDLANVLKGFNPLLEKWADTQAREDHQDLPGKVAQTIGGKTGEDAAAALAADPELQSRTAKRLGMAQVGLGVADSTAGEITQAYQTGQFDKDGGDFDKFAGGFIERDLKQYGHSDPNFAAQYRERLMARLNVLRNDLTTYRAGAASQQQDQQIYGAFLGTVNSGIDRADDPRAIADNLRQQLQTNKTIANKPVQEQEKLLVTMLGRLAGEIDQHPERADAIHSVIMTVAETSRADPTTKQDMGSLKDSTTVGGQVADVLRTAESAFNKQDQNNNWKSITELYRMARTADPNLPQALDAAIARKPKWFEQNERTSILEAHRKAVETKQAELAQQRAEQQETAAINTTTSQALAAGARGELHEVRDAEIVDRNGKPKIVSADEQVKAATDQRMRQIDQQAATNPKDTRTPFVDRVQWFTDNPQAVNEEWKTLLKSGPSGATTATLANGKIVSKATERGYQLYKDLQAAAPNVAFSHTDDRSREFYDRARVAEEVQHLPPAEALALSARALNAPREAVEPISPKDFNEKAQSALSRFWSTDVTDTVNSREAYGRLRQAAENLVRGNGIGWDEAIKQAAKNVEKDFTVINGVSVLTADKRVPPNFGRIANKFFDGWYAAHKDELDANHIGRSDLAMVNVNNTPNWRVVLKSTLGDPGVDDPGISLTDLYGTVKNLDDQEKIRGQRRMDAAGAERAASAFDAVNELEPQVKRGAAIIFDPYQRKFVPLAKAKANLEALKGSPEYAQGAQAHGKREAESFARRQQLPTSVTPGAFTVQRPAKPTPTTITP